MSSFITGEIIIIKKVILLIFILILGCSRSSVEANNKEAFNPFKNIDYSLYDIDDDKIAYMILNLHFIQFKRAHLF